MTNPFEKLLIYNEKTRTLHIMRIPLAAGISCKSGCGYFELADGVMNIIVFEVRAHRSIPFHEVRYTGSASKA